MKFLAGKEKLLILISAVFAILFFGKYIFAYDETIVHPTLTLEAAKLYNLNFSDKLSEQEINWIRQGSIDEDQIWGGIKQIRSSNHFYNPAGIKEWKDYNLDSKIPAYFSSGIGNGSKQWAHDSVAQSEYIGGDYTWERAIWDYAKGDKKHAYESLGHILHLIEDMTVPAHARNDFHLSPKELEAYQNWTIIRNFVDYEPYESWTGSQARSKELKFDFSDNLFQENKKPIIFSNLDNYFDSVAKYTVNNFFSKDTIYVYPEPNDNAIEGNEKLINGKVEDYVYGLSEDGQKFKLAKIFEDINTKQRVYDVSDKTPEIHSDYWSRLAPKSILAGAGIINLFKIEAEKAKNSEVALVKPDDYKSFYFVKPAANSVNQVKTTATAFYNWQISVASSIYKATASVAVSAYNTVNNTIAAFLNSAKSTIAYLYGAAYFTVQSAGAVATSTASSFQSQIGSFFNSTLGKITQYFSPNASASAKLVFDLSQPVKVMTIAEIYQASQFANEPDASEPEILDYDGELILGSSQEIVSIPGSDLNLELEIKNTGTAIWEGSRIFLSAFNGGNSQNFYNSSWVNSAMPSRLAESQLLPDKTGTFIFSIKSPNEAGDYSFSARPARKDSSGNLNWIGLDIARWQIKVKAKDTEIALEEDNNDLTVAENNLLPENQSAVFPPSPTPLAPSEAEGTPIPTPVIVYYSGAESGLPSADIVTSTPSVSPMPSLKPSVSPSPSPEATEGEATPTPSLEPLPSSSPEPSVSPTPMPSVSPAPSVSPSPSLSPSPSVSPTPEISPSPSPEPSASPSPTPEPSPSPTPEPTPIPKTPNLVISEIQTSGETADDEFIEIYNSLDSIVSLDGWSIQYRGGDAVSYHKKNFSSGDIVPAHGYFLIAHKDKYTGAVFPDMTWSVSLSGDGGTIFLSNSDVLLSEETDKGETVIDRIAWGIGKEAGESKESYLRAETKEFIDVPSDGQSLERKASENSDSASMAEGGIDEFMGNGWDSDDNSLDFVLKDSPDPQNSESAIEPIPAHVHNISRNKDYIKIQQAIDDAVSGDEIRVDSGTYSEKIKISKPLILKGIDTGSGQPIISDIGNGINILLTAGGATLDGFTIINGGWTSDAIFVQSSNNTIINNTIRAGVNAIYADKADNNYVNGNDILEGEYGIYFYLSNNNVISNNIVRSSDGEGIVLYSANNNLIERNVADSNKSEGIELIDADNNTVKGNISVNNHFGILLQNSEKNTVIENSVSLNTSYGFFIYGTSNNNRIYHNNILTNKHQAYSYKDIWDDDYPSGGNFWSDYMGIDSDGDGIGDTPYIIEGAKEELQDRYPLAKEYRAL